MNVDGCSAGFYGTKLHDGIDCVLCVVHTYMHVACPSRLSHDARQYRHYTVPIAATGTTPHTTHTDWWIPSYLCQAISSTLFRAAGSNCSSTVTMGPTTTTYYCSNTLSVYY